MVAIKLDGRECCEEDLTFRPCIRKNAKAGVFWYSGIIEINNVKKNGREFNLLKTKGGKLKFISKNEFTKYYEFVKRSVGDWKFNKEDK